MSLRRVGNFSDSVASSAENGFSKKDIVSPVEHAKESV
jgi:hypothetical protein